MSYRRQTGYNTHDTKIESTDARHYVKHNVDHRASIVLNAIIRFGAQGVSLSDLTVHLNERLNANYIPDDLKYAVKDKLIKDGLVEVIGRARYTRYRASPDAKQAWKDMPKKYI